MQQKKTMNLSAMGIALQRAGLKPTRGRLIQWPRNRGPRGIRVDVRTGHAVAFVRSQYESYVQGAIQQELLNS